MNLLADLRYGVRVLFQNRAFTIVAVLTIALGIGANTAMFSIVYSVLLRPLPYPAVDRLLVASLSYPEYRDLRESTRVFDRTAVWARNLYNLSGGGETEQILGAIVSSEFFELLGEPQLGRTFGAAEESQPLAVLSHGFWHRRFGGDRAVLGGPIELSGTRYTIVGVMRPEFQFPSAEFQVWVPAGHALGQAPTQLENRLLRIFRCIARVRPGATLGEARAEAAVLTDRLRREHPETNAEFELRFRPIEELLVGDVRPALFVLLGAVGFVLLIACANVANLALSRSVAREREIAVRAALGAGRLRIVRQLLSESLLLAGIGGVLGWIAALWTIEAVPRLVPTQIPRLDSVRLDGPVLAFTFALTFVTAVLFGLIPAVDASRTDLAETLKGAARGSSGSRRSSRWRSLLVVVEVALALVVLIGGGLLIKSFTRLVRVDAGFHSENLYTTNVQLVRYRDEERRAAAAAEIIERLAALPGVVAAGGGTGLPPVSAQRVTRFAAEQDGAAERDGRSAYFLAVTPGYFSALGTRLVEGRAFDARDGRGAPRVVILNATLARRLFPTRSAVGRRIRLLNPDTPDAWREIVGVVGDVRYSGLDDSGSAAIYTPFAQNPFLWTTLMLRVTGDPRPILAAVGGAVASVDPNLQVARVRSMDEIVSQSVAQPRFTMLLLGAFALLALVIAAVGVFGVVSYAVTQRTREIGVRIALGASRRNVLGMVVTHGMGLAAIGIGVGLAGAWAVTRLLTRLLFEVSPTDAGTFALVSVALGAVALAACYFPARRATRVDPMVILRYE